MNAGIWCVKIAILEDKQGDKEVINESILL